MCPTLCWQTIFAQRCVTLCSWLPEFVHAADTDPVTLTWTTFGLMQTLLIPVLQTLLILLPLRYPGRGVIHMPLRPSDRPSDRPSVRGSRRPTNWGGLGGRSPPRTKQYRLHHIKLNKIIWNITKQYETIKINMKSYKNYIKSHKIHIESYKIMQNPEKM